MWNQLQPFAMLRVASKRQEADEVTIKKAYRASADMCRHRKEVAVEVTVAVVDAVIITDMWSKCQEW